MADLKLDGLSMLLGITTAVGILALLDYLNVFPPNGILLTRGV